jgi:DUF2075 family protein
MAAYFKSSVQTFVSTPAGHVVDTLSRAILQRFAGNQQEQLKSWQEQITVLQAACRSLLERFPKSASWGLLLEYPLLRLQRRLDTVALSGQIVAVIEFKVGARSYQAGDVRQVEDYALDLRDFHYASHRLTIVPVLCATEAQGQPLPADREWGTVWPVHLTNAGTLSELLENLAAIPEVAEGPQISLDEWDRSPYRPVPTIIEAAELLYAGHEVQEIAHAAADVENLAATSDKLVEIVADAKAQRRRVMCFVTGVPGSGKTLTGLNLVHDKRIKDELAVKAAYLSGNTPLVEVLREALARDRNRRTREPLQETRRVVRTEVQHLMDYLREYIAEHPDHPPFENVVIFDEAQRAWDAAYGKQKFDREASEPALFLEIMARQRDWAVIVGLVGGGQEINVGEGGLREWGDALAAWAADPARPTWDIIAAPDVVFGGAATVGQSLFDQAYSYPGQLDTDQHLHLPVSVRSFRCEAMSTWVDHVLAGYIDTARKVAGSAGDFPVYITRELAVARALLRAEGRGNRRVGLVASSGARRLRADGLGVTLSANERDAYVHWYLEPKGDIRSSNALEVTANEYTCQGLELDYVGLCWGGDMLWSDEPKRWIFRELHGPRWKTVRSPATEIYIRNTYRVLMTRARLGIVLWVPHGDVSDATREPTSLDETAELLRAAGARPVGDEGDVSRALVRATADMPVKSVEP